MREKGTADDLKERKGDGKKILRFCKAAASFRGLTLCRTLNGNWKEGFSGKKGKGVPNHAGFHP